MDSVRCPVCRSELGTPAEATSLGAFVVDHGVHAHYFDSVTCKERFERDPKRFH